MLDRPGAGDDGRFHVHIENSRKMMPVFTVYPEQYEAALERHPDMKDKVRTTWGWDEDIFDSAAATANAFITYRFPKDRLKTGAPNLALLQVLGAGVDYLLPLDWLPDGVTMLTNSGAHVPKAAQSALMTLLMANARLPELAESQRKREWNRLFTSRLEGQTVLIVGVGAIGGGAAEMAKQFGMTVLGIRRSDKPHPAVDEMHGIGALHELLPRADFVLVNIALTDETRFLFGPREFAAMKPGASFINMSRGGHVDPAALDAALRSGHVRGAIIDVTYPEPPPADWPYWETPNLIITPHVLSDDIEEYIPRTLDLFFANVRAYLDKRPLTNVVDLERAY